MARTKPTTTYTPRTQPSTQYETTRWENFLLQEDTFRLLLEDWGGILLEWLTETNYTRPRYASYVEDMTWANVFDLSWELVQWISWNQVNKIDTVYT